MVKLHLPTISQSQVFNPYCEDLMEDMIKILDMKI